MDSKKDKPIKLADIGTGAYVSSRKYDAMKEKKIRLERQLNEAMVLLKKYALKNRLSEAGALDADYLIYKWGGEERFSFDKNGIPIDAEEPIKQMRDQYPHLFRTEADDKTDPVRIIAFAHK